MIAPTALPQTLPSSAGLSRGSDVPHVGRSRPAGALGQTGLDPRDTSEDDGGEGAGAGEGLARYGVLDLDCALVLARKRPVNALAKALLCVSGRSRPPAGAALERLLTRLAHDKAFSATLCGARIRADGGRVRLSRELGRSPSPPILLTPGAAQVFDGRFELVAQAPGWRVGPLAGRAAALPRHERVTVRGAPPEARPSLPVLLGPDGEIRLPEPLGGGPADARCLVAGRLMAALGLVESERALEQARRRRHGRSAAGALILS